MARIAFLAFLIIPIIEIAIFILLGQAIGLWPTLLGVLVTAVAGAVLLRLQGLSLIAEIRSSLSRGRMPARAIGDAMLIGIAAVLLITPGYFTDLLGILLLIPPVRARVYKLAAAFLVQGSIRTTGARRPEAPRTIDLDGDDYRPR